MSTENDYWPQVLAICSAIYGAAGQTGFSLWLVGCAMALVFLQKWATRNRVSP